MPSFAPWLDIESLLSPFKFTDEDVDRSLLFKHCFTFIFVVNLQQSPNKETDKLEASLSRQKGREDEVLHDFLLHLSLYYLTLPSCNPYRYIFTDSFCSGSVFINLKVISFNLR